MGCGLCTCHSKSQEKRCCPLVVSPNERAMASELVSPKASEEVWPLGVSSLVREAWPLYLEVHVPVKEVWPLSSVMTSLIWKEPVLACRF